MTGPKPHTCPTCSGKKESGGTACPTCSGTGVVWQPVEAVESAVAAPADPLDLTYRQADDQR